MTSRRQFLTSAATGTAAVIGGTRALSRLGVLSNGRLSARPRAPDDSIGPGTHRLSVGGVRDTVLFVPSSYRATKPAPFVLALHGATGDDNESLRRNRDVAERHGIIVLAPSSRGVSWDAIREDFGADLAMIDRALSQTFSQCSVDPARLAVSGFSDGATYAVSLALINGDLFTHCLAYSAGFVIAGPRRGKPKFFLSHGRQDRILPIDQCGRRIVAELKHDGYGVRFEEFDGPHTVPPGMVDTATAWFLG
jgi:phospholipase/carboxylesterase